MIYFRHYKDEEGKNKLKLKTGLFLHYFISSVHYIRFNFNRSMFQGCMQQIAKAKSRLVLCD